MLKELRKNELLCRGKQPWTKEKQRGICANKDCLSIATLACSRCGIRYCSKECQSCDWKNRHKHFCKETDIRRTKIVFNLFKGRLDAYKSGKSSVDRYFSIALYMSYLKLCGMPPSAAAQYTYAREGLSGRILTVLEDHEDQDPPTNRLVFRGSSLYLINSSTSPVPLTEEENQVRIEAGLLAKEAVELVPLNASWQDRYMNHSALKLASLMREALYREKRLPLLLIELAVSPGISWMYGNPVFLSLSSMLAYEDFIHKNIGSSDDDGCAFPMNLCCSILYPAEFRLSMITGRVEDDDKYFDLSSEDTFIEKSSAPPEMSRAYSHIFVEDVMEKEYADWNDALERREGETEQEAVQRYYERATKEDPFRYARFNMTTDCSESLAVCPLEQSCFAERSSGPGLASPSAESESESESESEDEEEAHEGSEQ